MISIFTTKPVQSVLACSVLNCDSIGNILNAMGYISEMRCFSCTANICDAQTFAVRKLHVVNLGVHYGGSIAIGVF